MAGRPRYIQVMSNVLKQPQRRSVARAPGKPAPLGWEESLERSEAQIAAGLTVPLEPVLDRLRATIRRMEAKRASTETT